MVGCSINRDRGDKVRSLNEKKEDKKLTVLLILFVIFLILWVSGVLVFSSIPDEIIELLGD